MRDGSSGYSWYSECVIYLRCGYSGLKAFVCQSATSMHENTTAKWLHSSHTTHTIHATVSRANLSTKKSSKSIATDQSRIDSREGSKVESIDWVDRQLSWTDRVARLDRFRGLSMRLPVFSGQPRLSSLLLQRMPYINQSLRRGLEWPK